MDGLTAKVFRTYNASKTLQDQLDLLTESKANVSEKVLAYNRANRQVALLCNHQRSIPKTFERSMETLKAKVGSRCAPRLQQCLRCSRSDRCEKSRSERTEERTETSENRIQELSKSSISEVGHFDRGQDFLSRRRSFSTRKMEQVEKKFQRSDEALKKLEVQALDREENKDIALGTSKLNYLDPRISVAW